MPRPIAEMSDAQINAEITNHKRHQRSGKPYSEAQSARYQELLEARGQRDGLKFEVSMRAIEAAARRREFISYGALAEANGVEWTLAYRRIGGHLWDLVEWAHARELPMLSAIVVNKQHLATGRMEPETLKGFTAAAEDLGHDVKDPEAFLREEQAKVFENYSGTATSQNSD